MMPVILQGGSFGHRERDLKSVTAVSKRSLQPTFCLLMHQTQLFYMIELGIEAKVCYSQILVKESYVLAKTVDVESCMANQLSRDVSVGPIL